MFVEERRKSVPQGLKPSSGPNLHGTAEAVPFVQRGFFMDGFRSIPISKTLHRPGDARWVPLQDPVLEFGGRKAPNSIGKINTLEVLRLRTTKRCVTR
jgi:hypothetical protein